MTPTCRRCGHPLHTEQTQAAGLGRYCQGHRMPPVPPSLLADLLAAFGSEDRLWSQILCARLAAARPDEYANWTPTILAAALKLHGIRTRQTWGPGPGRAQRNRSGVTRSDVAIAHAASRTPLGSSGAASTRAPR